MANKHVKRPSTSLVSREMQIEATVRYHFTATRTALVKKTESQVWVRMCGNWKGQILCGPTHRRSLEESHP